MISKILNAVVALLLLAVIGISVIGTEWVTTPLTFVEGDSSGIVHVGQLVFTAYVIPFEALSLVLLAALIGGIYLAKKEASA